MSKKTSSCSVIDYFFYQRKDTLQIIGQYGVSWLYIAWFFWCVFLVLWATRMGFNAHVQYIKTVIGMKVSPEHMGYIKGWMVCMISAMPLPFFHSLFRRYAKGDVFSVKNTGLMVVLSLLVFFCWNMMGGIFLMGVAIVVPSHDQDTPKTDA